MKAKLFDFREIVDGVYYDVTFFKPFGKIPANELISEVAIDNTEQEIVCYSASGTEIYRQPFNIFAKSA